MGNRSVFWDVVATMPTFTPSSMAKVRSRLERKGDLLSVEGLNVEPKDSKGGSGA